MAALSAILLDNLGSTGNLLYDVTGRAENLEFSTNQHGFQGCSFQLDFTLRQALRLYDRPGLPCLRIGYAGSSIWEGRLEVPKLTDVDLQLRFFGGWRAYMDTRYTALWSSTSLSRWQSLDDTQISTATPGRFTINKENGALYIAPQKNTKHSSSRVAYYGFKIPSRSSRQLVAISFDYSWSNGSGWQWIVETRSSAWVAGSTVDTVTGTGGAVSTGTKTLVLPATDAVSILFRSTSGVDVDYTSETGTQYLRISNVRVKTISTSVGQDAIIKDLVAHVAGINSSLVNANTSLIGAPGLDLPDETYLDMIPADIINRLISLGDTQTPPELWEAAVWENLQLVVRRRGSGGRTWYIDATSLEIERDLDQLFNSMYSVYQDAAGDDVRGTTSTDSASVLQYGITRQDAISVATTSSSIATLQRDATLNDRKTIRPTTSVPIAEVFDAYGARWPLFYVRSGDTVIIRNLSSNLSTTIDRARSFIVAETTYNASTDTLTVVPEAPIASVAVMLARRAAGIS